MANTDPLLLDNQLCFSLYSTSLAMTQLYKPLLEPLGLTYPQYLILLILWEKDGVALKDIGERLGQKSGALTPVLKRLEQEGHISRGRSSEDERALAVYLTAQGRALKQQAAAVNQCLLASCQVDIQQLQELKQQLDQLRQRLLHVAENFA